VDVTIVQLVNVNVILGVSIVIVLLIYQNGSVGLGLVQCGGGYSGQLGLCYWVLD
jgi:hypothetical protein